MKQLKQNKTKVSNKMNKKLNNDNSTMFIDDGIDIDNRRIHLIGDIVSEKCSKIISGIQLMLAKNKEDPINIFINSHGGCVYSSFGLYNFLKAQDNVEIKTINIGCVMSGASVIFLAGDKRYMYKDTVFMLHTVSSSSSDGRLFVDMVPDLEETKKLYIQMCKIYEENTNLDYKEWYRKLKFQDQYFRAKESIELGIVDKIIEKESEVLNDE